MSHHGGAAQTARAAEPPQTFSLKQRRPTLSSSAVAVSEFSNPNLEPLFTSEQIQTRVAEMGAEISRDYAGQTPLLIGVLKGAYIFLSDLVRATDLRLGVEFMAISSYGSGMRSSGEVRIVKDLDVPVDGRDILIVEDRSEEHTSELQSRVDISYD